MMSNLPPGVTESMIPGNRPEDIEEDAFWEGVYEKAEEVGLPEDIFYGPLEKGLIDLIRWAASTSYNKGYQQGIADAELESYYRNSLDKDIEGGDNITD